MKVKSCTAFDSYNTLIKVKFADVLEKLEEKLPVKPFTDEYKGIEDFRKKKVFMFSDIQKLISVLGALFFFAIFVSEITPLFALMFGKISSLFSSFRGGL